MKGADLDKLILVGGPTHSPILRQMLREQITENIDTSVDPMTVVAKGAALYASTVEINDDIQDQTRDETKLQLDVKYEATSVEINELINIKVLKDKSVGIFPKDIFAEVVRSDGGWSSAKTRIGEKSVLIEVLLEEGRSNTFTVNIYDGQGNRIECEPHQFNILQGISGLDSMQVLPSHICIVKHFEDEEKDLILPVKGLEKNKRYPATGVTNGLKTRQAVRPGMAKDIIRIPIYEGDYNDTKTNPELNNLIYEVIITGESLPALLPEDSDVDITIKVDKSGLMKFSACFPALDHTEELDIPIKNNNVPEVNDLSKKISNAKKSANNVNADDIYDRLDALEQQLENEKGSDDGRMKIMDSVRKELLKLDEAEKAASWPKIEKELKEVFYELEDLVEQIKRNGHDDDLNMNRIETHVREYKEKVRQIIREKNQKEAKELISKINSLDFDIRNTVTGNAIDVQYLRHLNDNFGNYHWKDATKARQLINRGMQIAANGNNNVRSILIEIIQLIPTNELPKDTLR